ncbi:MAG TPA: response regulator [Chryseosolibacter sp.]
MKKIIFADDDPSIQEVINLILEDDYKITTFSRGEPLMNNEFEVPDLFLVDKQLPGGVDGLDICKFLKNQEKTRNVPVIVISASPNLKKLAKAAGADDSIEKPFPITELRNLIATYTKSLARPYA